jgi:hypothetical protein
VTQVTEGEMGRRYFENEIEFHFHRGAPWRVFSSFAISPVPSLSAVASFSRAGVRHCGWQDG